MAKPLETPDGRYIVVRGRLWRTARPDLPPDRHQELVRQLMAARRGVKEAADDEEALRTARKAVDAAKRGLGERGPVWWTDGAPDFNRFLVKNTPYREWFEGAKAGEEREPADEAGRSSLENRKRPPR